MNTFYGLWFLVSMLACDMACGTIEKSAGPDALYATQVLACVEHANTLQESKECRKHVEESWGYVSDAGGLGSEGGK